MSASHTHALPSTGNERALRLALVLTFGFLMTEVVGGILTGSLALISDAAHIFALAIALAAIRIARRPADVRRTYGYHRFEILAAFNALLLFAVALYILGEAYQRFLHTPEVHPTGMLVIAGIGLVVNLVSLRLLSGGQVSLTAHVVHDRSFSLEGDLIPTWPSASRSFTRHCNAKPPPATARRGGCTYVAGTPGYMEEPHRHSSSYQPKGSNPMKLLHVITVLAAFCAIHQASAADDHKGHAHDEKPGQAHAHDVKPQHGGIVSVVKDINYELVAKADALTLYVTDHDQPVDTKNASATMTLLSASEKTEAKLLPAGGNKLQAQGAFKIQPGMKAAALVKLGDKASQVVRFTLR